MTKSKKSSDRKILIMIHGVRGNHKGLSFISRRLKRLYEVHNIDLPGSGSRAELNNKTLDGYADWLHNYVESHNFESKPYFFAHSMGTIIVSYYIEKYPRDTANKIILMSPIFRTEKGQWRSNNSCNWIMRFLKLLPMATRYKMLKSKWLSWAISHFLTIDKTKQKRIDELHFKYSGQFSSANSIMADLTISMREQVRPPKNKKVLYLIGAHDRLVRLDLVTSKKDENNKVIIYEKYGHLLNYECPNCVARDVAKFIG